jgi:hypothetical protein
MRNDLNPLIRAQDIGLIYEKARLSGSFPLSAIHLLFSFSGGTAYPEHYLADLTDEERRDLTARYKLDFLLFGYQPFL